MLSLRICSLFLLIGWMGAPSQARAQEGEARQLTFSVSFSRDWRREPVDGSVYLLITRELLGEPRERVGSLTNPPWIFRIDVRGLQRGEAVVFDRTTPGHPTGLGDLPPGDYAWQAVIHADAGDYDFTRARDNGRSRLQRGFLDSTAAQSVAITVDAAVEPSVLEDRGRIRYRRIESRNVGRVLGERHFIDVAVLVPVGYGAALEQGQVYPVQYFVPTLGRRVAGAIGYFQGLGVYNRALRAPGEMPHAVRVLIDPHGPWGHHLWSDSSVNGPFMTAFFEEIVPAIEAEFAIHRAPESRVLIGHGTGGWAAVNLMAHRPDFFACAFALAPDPLDFREFYGVDLRAHAGVDALEEETGRPRPLARHDGQPLLSWGEQARYEHVLKRGGIFRSFATALAPAGSHGAPLTTDPPRLFDLESGAFNPAVVLAMLEQEPLRLIVEGSEAKRRQLDGKIHVLVGDRDDFELALPALSFASALEEAGVDVEVEVLDDVDHAGANAPEVHARVQQRIADLLRAAAKN